LSNISKVFFFLRSLGVFDVCWLKARLVEKTPAMIAAQAAN
jgi:hypothetical protein